MACARHEHRGGHSGGARGSGEATERLQTPAWCSRPKPRWQGRPASSCSCSSARQEHTRRRRCIRTRAHRVTVREAAAVCNGRHAGHGEVEVEGAQVHQRPVWKNGQATGETAGGYRQEVVACRRGQSGVSSRSCLRECCCDCFAALHWRRYSITLAAVCHQFVLAALCTRAIQVRLGKFRVAV